MNRITGLSWAARIYRAALGAFPADFRAVHAEELLATFDEAMGSRRSTLARVAFLAVLVTEALWQGLGERWYHRRRRATSSRRREISPMKAIKDELRMVLRGLRRTPGFTTIAILILTLGIGANAAIFSVVNGVVLKPLPYPESDELVLLFHWYPESELQASVSVPAFLDYQEMNQSFTDLAAVSGFATNLTGVGDPIRLQGSSVTEGFFGILGVQPSLGRGFVTEDHETGARVVVLADGLWRRQFGADPDVIGRTVSLDGETHTVIGVMPPGTGWPNAAELWRPLELTPEMANPANRGREFLVLMGRAKEGITFERLTADMDEISARLRPEYYSWTTGWRILPVRLIDQTIGSVRPMIWTLFAAVGLVLLITCVNVANLLLARGNSRQREVAVRVALGGGRWAAARTAMVESMTLALAGAAGGLIMATGLVRVLVAIAPPSLPRLDQVGVDPTVLAFTGAVALGAGLLFGAAPAWRASGADPREALASGGAKASPSRKSQRLSRFLIGAEVALAVVLVVGAGLVLQSFQGLVDAEVGFEAEGRIALDVDLSTASYPDPASHVAFFNRVTGDILALPGVTAFGAINAPPLSGRDPGSSFFPEGVEVTRSSVPQSSRRVVTPGYFAAAGIPLVAGREFTPADMEPDAAPVVVVDRKTAETFWPGEDPLTKAVGVVGDSTRYSIVGVVGDVLHEGAGQPYHFHIYQPVGQNASGRMTMIAATLGDPSALAKPITDAVHALDPRQPVFAVRPLVDYLDDSTAPARFNATLLALFGLVALTLAGVGVYGVVSYAMTQKTQEIGIRMALGGERRAVLRQLVTKSIVPAVVGVAVGVAGSLMLMPLAAGMLFGVSPGDPATLAGVSLLLLLTGLLACYLPARRAILGEPTKAMRYE